MAKANNVFKGNKSPFDKSDWVRLYVEDGLTMQEIADRFGTCGPVVFRFLNNMKVETRPAKARGWDLEVTERKCSFCRTVRPISEFYNNANNRTGKGYICKHCLGHGENYSDKVLQQIFEKDPGICDRLLTEQNHLCACCDRPETQRSRLVIDHCHEKSIIRGMLCTKCNTAIGLLGDNYESVMKAANYLKDK